MEDAGEGVRAPAYLHLDIPGNGIGSATSTTPTRHTPNKQFGYGGGAGSMTPRVHAWLDIKFFYVKVTSYQGGGGGGGAQQQQQQLPQQQQGAEAVPETLTVRYLPRTIGTELEVNGGRIPPSEHCCTHLRRDRMDPDAAEVTYVSTDHLRATGSVAFEILEDDELLLLGALEYTEDTVSASSSPAVVGGAGAGAAGAAADYDDGSFEASPRSPSAKSVRLGWTMDCTCALGPNGCSFTSKARHDYSASAVTLAPPAMEICVVGRYLGPPVVLTQTVSLTARRRNSVRRGTLDAIPEGDVLDRNTVTLILPDQNGQVRTYVHVCGGVLFASLVCSSPPLLM